jgi:DNA-binding transcriptional MerR regulator
MNDQVQFGMPSDPTESPSLLPVRVVVERTGLSADVLRAWERRYSVVVPQRTTGGQRVYSEANVQRLQELAQLVARGHSIGHLAHATPSELAELRESALHSAASLPSAATTDPIVAGALDATERLDAKSLERVLRGAALRLGIDEMLDDVLAPLLITIGERWHQGTLRTANEHLATAVIRATLAWMMELAAPAADAPSVVVSTPAGQLHELGAMIAAASIAAQGARVIYLGPNLPAAEIAVAAIQTRASAVALSLVYPEHDAALGGELSTLRKALPPRIDLLVGGAAVDRYEAELIIAAARVEHSLDGLRAYVRGLLR